MSDYEVEFTDVETGWQCRECFLDPVFPDSKLQEAEKHMIEEHGKNPEELREIGIVKPDFNRTPTEEGDSGE